MRVEYVILVNNNDQPLGAMEKMEAHEKGMLHRAFSIFIFNSAGKLLMQRRAEEKYHSAGLWTNTVCSHPRTGEKTPDAAHRRLREEMGFDCDLEEVYAFTYKAHVGDGMTEHEFDHVFVGHSDEMPNPDPEEVSEWKYVDMDWLINDVKENPDKYTIWFRKILHEAKFHLTKART